MWTSKRILVADLPPGVNTVRQVAGNLATVLHARSLPEAISLLKSGVDLVVCGLHFDESRMYDLLRMAKADPATRRTPFVCVRDIDSALSEPLLHGLEIACTALGAARFVDLYQLKTQHGIEEADRQFRETLLAFLDGPAA